MEDDSFTSLIVFCSSAYWIIFNIIWLINSKLLSNLHLKPIHLLISLTLTTKSFLSLFTTLPYLNPDISPLLESFSLFQKSFSALYLTLFNTLLILFSKGLGISKNSLNKDEMIEITIIIGFLFISCNIYTYYQSIIEIFYIMIELICLYFIHVNYLKNLKSLSDTLNSIRQSNSIERNSLIISDLFKTKLIRSLSFLLILSSLSCNFLLAYAEWTGLNLSLIVLDWLKIIEEVFCVICGTWIYILFMSGVRMDERRVIEDYEELRRGSFDRVFEGNIRFGDQNDDGVGDGPLIWAAPWRDFDVDRPYDGILFGLPVEVKFKSNIGGELNQPLLNI